jgi:hypothetical protein
MDYQRVYAKIDLDAIAHNIALVKGKIAVGTKLMLVIKADAYGHGAVEIAKQFENEADYDRIDLSDEFKTVKVTVDFSAKTVSAYDEGGNLQTLSFTPSEIHTDAESLKGAFSEMLGLWAGSAGSVRIGGIKITDEEFS